MRVNPSSAELSWFLGFRGKRKEWEGRARVFNAKKQRCAKEYKDRKECVGGIDDGGEMNIILFAETKKYTIFNSASERECRTGAQGARKNNTSNLIEPAWVWFESL